MPMRDIRQGECVRAGGSSVTFADAARVAVEAGRIRAGDVLYIAAPPTPHASVDELRGALADVGVATTNLTDLLALTGLALPGTTPSCADGGKDKRPCPRSNFDYISSVDQLLVAAARGAHIANFPSTWDELTIELQCEAHDAALPSTEAPRCARHDFIEANDTVTAPLFSPRYNKHRWASAVAFYCGVF